MGHNQFQLVHRLRRNRRHGLEHGNDADFQADGPAAITVNGAQSVGNITFDGSGYNVGGGTLTLTGGNITANRDATIASALGGRAGLTKLGGGALALYGNSTYSGATQVNGGTLQLGVDNALPAGTAVYVNNAGSNLDLAGNAQSVVTLYINNGATMTQSSGSLTASNGAYNTVFQLGDTSGNAANYGNYNMAGGALTMLGLTKTLLYNGTFTQTGGLVAVQGYLCLGSTYPSAAGGVGAYAISGGSLNVGAAGGDISLCDGTAASASSPSAAAAWSTPRTSASPTATPPPAR